MWPVIVFLAVVCDLPFLHLSCNRVISKCSSAAVEWLRDLRCGLLWLTLWLLPGTLISKATIVDILDKGSGAVIIINGEHSVLNNLWTHFWKCLKCSLLTTSLPLVTRWLDNGLIGNWMSAGTDDVLIRTCHVICHSTDIPGTSISLIY